MGIITEHQENELKKDFPRDWIKRRKHDNMEYLPGWRAIMRANEIFGFDGWSHDVIETVCVSEKQKPNSNNVIVVVRAKVRVHALGVSKEDVGICVGDANIITAHDLAWKGAVTDATKRALRHFGIQFGLALYDESREFVGATSDGQSFMADAKALAENTSDIDAWIESNGDLVDALPQDERTMVWDVVSAKQAKAKIAVFEAGITAAANMGELGQIYHALKDQSFDRATHDRLVTACQARKAQLGKAAA